MTDTLTWLIKQLESTWFPASYSYEWRDPTEASNCCGGSYFRLTGLGLRKIHSLITDQNNYSVSVFTSVHAAYIYVAVYVDTFWWKRYCTVLILKIDPIITSYWLLFAEIMLLLFTCTFLKTKESDKTWSWTLLQQYLLPTLIDSSTVDGTTINQQICCWFNAGSKIYKNIWFARVFMNPI